MKRVLMASVFLLGLTGFTNAAELTQADAQRICQSLGDQFIQSFKAKQPEKMASVFTDDGWRITDNGPIIGKEALLKHFEAAVRSLTWTTPILIRLRCWTTKTSNRPDIGREHSSCPICRPNHRPGFGSIP